PFDTEGWQAGYEELPGWQSDLTAITQESQFPKAFSDYIKYLENHLGVPITIVSVGPDRAQTIVRE
ncbi:MAG: adenylosuccinate synthetase, partial [Bacteroidaceae bacterium]|nr:adenylosuccinate synthetase [Bacteroidaceae bacterium]